MIISDLRLYYCPYFMAVLAALRELECPKSNKDPIAIFSVKSLALGTEFLLLYHGVFLSYMI